MESDDLQPAGKGLGEGRQEQNVGGAGKDESAGYPVPVDFELQGREEFRGELDLVQDDAFREVGDEPGGIRPSAIPHDGIVEADVSVVPLLP